MTIAVLMYSSGRTAFLQRSGDGGQEIPHHEAGDERDQEARLAGHAERPGQAEIFTLVRRGCDVAVVASQPAKVAEPKKSR